MANDLEVAGEEYGILRYRLYSEREAAALIGIDVASLAHKRRAGLVPYVEDSTGVIRYMGYQIIDIIRFRREREE